MSDSTGGSAPIANALTNVVQTPPSVALATPPIPPVHPALGEAHIAAAAKFDVIQKAFSRVQLIQSGLQSLGKLGDLVSPEDVVKEAGTLVGHGEDPLQVAGFMADMPDQPGEALAGWIAQHAQANAQNVAKIGAALGQARHDLGVASLHVLVGHSLNPQSPAPALQPQATDGIALNPQATGNALTTRPQGVL